MIVVKSSGSFKKTDNFLRRALKTDIMSILKKYAERGVDALSKNTPVDTGKTAASWGYEIIKKENNYTINWTNSNIVNHVCIAMIIQYGHATRQGAYVQGVDYINPAMKPIFDELADKIWKEVNG